MKFNISETVLTFNANAKFAENPPEIGQSIYKIEVCLNYLIALVKVYLI